MMLTGDLTCCFRYGFISIYSLSSLGRPDIQPEIHSPEALAGEDLAGLVCCSMACSASISSPLSSAWLMSLQMAGAIFGRFLAFDDRQIIRIGKHVAHEALVDLEFINRQALAVGQQQVTSTVLTQFQESFINKYHKDPYLYAM